MLMRRVYIGLGANIEPEHHIRTALEHLSRHVELLGVSTFYRTKAIGRPEQADYLNGVVLAQSDMEAHDIKFRVLRPIETALGRIRSRDAYAPRPIDLDILLYGDECIRDSQLVVPAPELAERIFLAAGVLELEPDLRLPQSGARLADNVEAAAIAALDAADEFSREMKERYCTHE